MSNSSLVIFTPLFQCGWPPWCWRIFASLPPRARQRLLLGTLITERDGLPSSLKRANQERRFVESKYTSTTSPSLNFPIEIGQQSNTGRKKDYSNRMCGKHAAPTCLLLSNWKSQSVVLPSKFNSKHFNLTRYQTAGHATWKVGGQHTMDDWTCHLRQCANILCRTNSRRMLSKVTPTATCFNGTPTFGKHGLTLTDKISKKIGTRKGILIIPNDRRQL